jgi:hypothetical protein
MLLLVRDDERLEQTMRQLEKLEDVLLLERLTGDCPAFTDATRWLEPSPAPEGGTA